MLFLIISFLLYISSQWRHFRRTSWACRDSTAITWFIPLLLFTSKGKDKIFVLIYIYLFSSLSDIKQSQSFSLKEGRIHRGCQQKSMRGCAAATEMGYQNTGCVFLPETCRKASASAECEFQVAVSCCKEALTTVRTITGLSLWTMHSILCP